jgi:hypothetical protein
VGTIILDSNGVTFAGEFSALGRLRRHPPLSMVDAFVYYLDTGGWSFSLQLSITSSKEFGLRNTLISRAHHPSSNSKMPSSSSEISSSMSTS